MAASDSKGRARVAAAGGRKTDLLLVALFVLGALVMAYPLVNRILYRQAARVMVTDFLSGAAAIDKEAVGKKLELAHAYNSTLNPARLFDPYTEKEKEGVAEYARMLEVHEQIGVIVIPKIGVELPVRAGTSDAVLQQGAGHMQGTSLPVGGPSTHAVITAHRGLPTARLFNDLDKLEVGDIFYVRNIGGTLAYQVDRILTVGPSDFEKVLVEKGQDQLTLLTCTPYMINSHRLLVRGHRIPYEEAAPPSAQRTTLISVIGWEWFALALLPVAGGAFWWFLFKRQPKEKEVSFGDENATSAKAFPPTKPSLGTRRPRKPPEAFEDSERDFSAATLPASANAPKRRAYDLPFQSSEQPSSASASAIGAEGQDLSQGAVPSAGASAPSAGPSSTDTALKKSPPPIPSSPPTQGGKIRYVPKDKRNQ